MDTLIVMEKLLILFAVAAFGLDLYADEEKKSDYSNCFIPGEVSHYKVTWGIVPVVWSTTETEKVMDGERELICIRQISQSYPAYNALYKVDDKTEVLIDPQTALPIKLDLEINEGRQHKNYLTTFDHKNRIAIYTNRISGEVRKIQIQKDTREILSFMYSMRNQSIENLAFQKYQLLVEGKLYDLELNLNDLDMIPLNRYGEVASISFDPIAEFDGMFLREGKITFWISQKPRRMITCIQAKVGIGKIQVKLDEVSGPGDDFWITAKKTNE